MLPVDDPIEDFSEEDMATGSMAAAGRSPNKHPRTGSMLPSWIVLLIASAHAWIRLNDGSFGEAN